MDRERERNEGATPKRNPPNRSHICISILNGADLNARVLPAKVIGKFRQARRAGELAGRMAKTRNALPAPQLPVNPCLPFRADGRSGDGYRHQIKPIASTASVARLTTGMNG